MRSSKSWIMAKGLRWNSLLWHESTRSTLSNKETQIKLENKSRLKIGKQMLPYGSDRSSSKLTLDWIGNYLEDPIRSFSKTELFKYQIVNKPLPFIQQITDNQVFSVDFDWSVLLSLVSNICTYLETQRLVASCQVRTSESWVFLGRSYEKY